jgi:5,10-methylenetetrahydrofolate reductase
MTFLARLQDPHPLMMVELRPPRRGVSAQHSMDSWIDLNHTVRRLTDEGVHILLTDNAVGENEEESLVHLMANLGSDADPDAIVPMLTCKHSMDYCLRFPQRAAQQGHRSLVVLGGDTHDGVPRCVDHAYQLRGAIRSRQPALSLGGWANPHRDPVRQVEYLLSQEAAADFYLTQVVSHYDLKGVDTFLDEASRRGLQMPGVFGVFFYRSANPRTLQALQPFFPVPAEQLQHDLAADGPGPEQVCARTVAALRQRGIQRVYISNLHPERAAHRLGRIQALLANRVSL